MKVRKNESFATGLSIVTFQFYFSFCQQLQFLSSSTSAMLQLCSLFHTCMSGNRDVDIQSANNHIIFSARLSKQSGYKRLTTILLPLAHVGLTGTKVLCLYYRTGCKPLFFSLLLIQVVKLDFYFRKILSCFVLVY